MKKLRFISILLLACMIFTQVSASAYASSEVTNPNQLNGIRSTQVITKDLSVNPNTFEAINAEGWDVFTLTLNGVAYEPFVTEKGYMLVRNGELTLAGLAPSVAEELGDGTDLDNLRIVQGKLTDKRITRELLNELAALIEKGEATATFTQGDTMRLISELENLDIESAASKFLEFMQQHSLWYDHLM